MQQNISLNDIGRSKKTARFALFNLGFRPFFLLATVFSIISIVAWMDIYMAGRQLSLLHVTPSQWHAHEMLYGYAFAVIAGFLLTAVKNWTGEQTLHGKPLMALVLCWGLVRLLMLINPGLSMLAATFDIGFNLLLAMAIFYPIAKVKQWRQMGILVKVFLLTLGNIAFYANALGWWENGAQVSSYMGLFLSISLILVISRRVLPMFIERGVAEKIVLKQHKWADVSIMVFLVLLLVNALSYQHAASNIALGILMFLVNGFRLAHWHTKGIWRVALLWSFYCGLWLVNLGFLFFSLSFFMQNISPIFAIHLWALGGIGLITLSMMVRVSLGHTGRNIHEPPTLMRYAFGLMVVATIARAVVPAITSQYYLLLVMLAAVCWVLAFAFFFAKFHRILTQSRIDGAQG